MSSLRPPVMAANWKMNNGPSAARDFMRRFLGQYHARTDRTVVFFPPALSVLAVVESLSTR
jgi:triosephosphate isomerase